jgi:hypothetical protein
MIKIKIEDCEKITEDIHIKLQETLNSFGKLKIFKIEHDGKLLEDINPKRGEWLFDKRMQHFKKKPVKKKQVV